MKKIQITNDITKFTLKKIYFGFVKNYIEVAKCLDELSDMNQFAENVENYYITEDALNHIVDVLFREKKGGEFMGTISSLFGTRAKCRFVKAKLDELRK